MTTTLLEPRVADALRTLEPLGSVDAHDALAGCDHTLAAYREFDRRTGGWRIRVLSSRTPGAVFEPAEIQAQARKAAAEGRTWFRWGFNLQPTRSDPRQIEFRVYQKDGRPTHLELVLRMRKFYGSADDAKTLSIEWPG